MINSGQLNVDGASRKVEIVARLRRRILNGLHLGRLRAGDRVPSAREIAAEFGVDQRTALSAYKELVVEGLVELRPRSGMYVAERSERSLARLTELARSGTEVFLQGTDRDIAPIDLPTRLRRCLDTVRLRCACIECNADQIRSLCIELQSDYGLSTLPIELEVLAGGDLAALSDVDLLVTTMYHTSEVQRIARSVRKPSIAISLKHDLVDEFLADLARGPTYFVATDPRFESKLREIFRDTPGSDNLRTAIVGRDDLDAIPEDAPTHLMRRVREMLPDSGLVRRSPPAGRAFSQGSVREILTFIINANLRAMAGEGADQPGRLFADNNSGT
jgi:DNA-binding transcriptional regulator YhcF (GntR family)